MILFVLFVLAVAIFLATGWHRRLSLEAVIEYREALEVLVAGHRFEALVIYMAVYAVAAGLSMPGVVFLNIGGGMIFGGLLAGFAATVAATAGATGIFLLAKTALRDIVKRWTGAHAERFAAGFREDAFNYLLFMRLVPIFPFAMGNLLPALCGVGVGTFFVATILGVIPMTMAFTFFGASLDEALASHIADYRACVADAGVNCQVRFKFGKC